MIGEHSMRSTAGPQWSSPGWDIGLALTVAALLSFSLVMVLSTTLSMDTPTGSGFRYFYKHLAAIGIGVAIMALVGRVRIEHWQRMSRILMPLGIILLVLVLLPGIGREVNGSTRWFAFGPIRFQPSELVKVLTVIYLADYFARNSTRIREFRVGIGQAAIVVGTLGVLLLLEPDLGSTVVIAATAAAMMFLSGVRIYHLMVCGLIAALLFVALTVVSPYRMERVMSFQDPFSDPFGSGFQLVQALIAFGRGEWTGVGLGASIQKLFYLPHANNDFLAAVIAEELGFVGIAVLIGLYVSLTWRAFMIAANAVNRGSLFGARLAQGVGLLLILQATINLGVNMGVLPTKGLTLPLMSYGGSSLVMSCFAVGLLFAVDRSCRFRQRHEG